MLADFSSPGASGAQGAERQYHGRALRCGEAGHAGAAGGHFRPVADMAVVVKTVSESHLGVGQNQTRGPQILVHVSTYQVPFWVPFFDPQPFWLVGEFTTHFRTFCGWIGMFTGGTIWILTYGQMNVFLCSLVGFTGMNHWTNVFVFFLERLKQMEEVHSESSELELVCMWPRSEQIDLAFLLVTICQDPKREPLIPGPVLRLGKQSLQPLYRYKAKLFILFIYFLGWLVVDMDTRQPGKPFPKLQHVCGRRTSPAPRKADMAARGVSDAWPNDPRQCGERFGSTMSLAVGVWIEPLVCIHTCFKS